MPNKTIRIRFAAGAFLAIGLTVPASATALDLTPALNSINKAAADKVAKAKAAPVLGGFMQAATPATPPVNKRSLTSPLDSPPMPFTEWCAEGYTVIGDNWDSSTGWLQKAIYGKQADSSRTKIYGWLDLGYTASTADHNTSPLSYGFMPNRPVLDQAVVRVERMVDTTQTAHTDYGYRVDAIYGTDYRYTAGDGYWFSQLQQHNQLMGADAPEAYGLYYFPKIAQGAVLLVGRWISNIDIEAQLAPQNYTYSHSLMFSVDPYTYTGATMQVRWSKNWQTLTGFQFGNDKTPWEQSNHLNGLFDFGWHSDSNRDAIWFGADSIGGGLYKDGHDDLQIASISWGHKFDDHLHVQSQMYYMWERDAELGGTENDGPIEPYGLGGGAAPIIPGTEHVNGFVTYWNYQINRANFLSARFDILNDPQGIRTGYPNFYTSYTLSYNHWINSNITFRPEVRFDNANMNPSYDNGTKKTMWTLGGDIIIHF